jgi:hypothetical protein
MFFALSIDMVWFVGRIGLGVFAVLFGSFILIPAKSEAQFAYFEPAPRFDLSGVLDLGSEVFDQRAFAGICGENYGLPATGIRTGFPAGAAVVIEIELVEAFDLVNFNLYFSPADDWLYGEDDRPFSKTLVDDIDFRVERDASDPFVAYVYVNLPYEQTDDATLQIIQSDFLGNEVFRSCADLDIGIDGVLKVGNGLGQPSGPDTIEDISGSDADDNLVSDGLNYDANAIVSFSSSGGCSLQLSSSSALAQFVFCLLAFFLIFRIILRRLV